MSGVAAKSPIVTVGGTVEFGPVWPLSVFWELGRFTDKCEACGNSTSDKEWNTTIGTPDGKYLALCEECGHFLLEVLLRRFLKGVKGREPVVLTGEGLKKEPEESGEEVKEAKVVSSTTITVIPPPLPPASPTNEIPASWLGEGE